MPSPRVVAKRRKTGELLVDLRGLADSEKRLGAIVEMTHQRRFVVMRLNDKTATLKEVTVSDKP